MLLRRAVPGVFLHAGLHAVCFVKRRCPEAQVQKVKAAADSFYEFPSILFSGKKKSTFLFPRREFEFTALSAR